MWEGSVELIEDVVVVEGDSVILPKVPDAPQVPTMIFVVELLEGSSSPEGEEGSDTVLQRHRVPCAERLTPIEAQEISTAEKLGAIGGPDLGLLSSIGTGIFPWGFLRVCFWNQTCWGQQYFEVLFDGCIPKGKVERGKVKLLGVEQWRRSRSCLSR